ncbi:hypothetical protein K501DRAFT_279050 [Backusella circina FSU 941]|nr:hypothetical protein K501DRAFT_279050 [Backusella circina FSU 941]
MTDRPSYRINSPPNFNSSSPVYFPSASPTPKLYSTPANKVPESKPWNELALESVPQNSSNIYNGNGKENDLNLYTREKVYYRQTASASPLSELDDDQGLTSSYLHFSSEGDLLSSIISSRTSTSSPPYYRSNSFSTPSPALEPEVIVGTPYVAHTSHDPIERRRRFSSGSPVPDEYSKTDSNKSNTFGSFGKSLFSKMKKATKNNK